LVFKEAIKLFKSGKT